VGGRWSEVVFERSPGAASAPLPGAYRRHEPEKTLLYQIVDREFPAYAGALRERGPGAGLPAFVDRAVQAYLDCGRLERGFARVRCDTCRDEFLVALSCKTRGLCPSCATRRMHDVAAHLVDRVFPHVPARQWVLTFPRRVRWHLAADPKLACEAVRLFVAALFTDLRRRAREGGVVIPGPARARARACAAVSFLQRFGSDLTLNFHVHTVAVDGIFLHHDPFGEERPRFVPLPPPTDEEVQRLCLRVARRVLALLARRGRLDADEADLPLGEALVSPYVTASRSPAVAAEDAAPPPPRLCARIDGFSLHAGTAIHENDRAGLERLLRYAGRPPLALERLSLDPDGRVRYTMKRTFRDGRRDIVLAPADFIARLCALLPPPRSHQLRYHGVVCSSRLGFSRIEVIHSRRACGYAGS
jgi:hypothetical protein